MYLFTKLRIFNVLCFSLITCVGCHSGGTTPSPLIDNHRPVLTSTISQQALTEFKEHIAMLSWNINGESDTCTGYLAANGILTAGHCVIQLEQSELNYDNKHEVKITVQAGTTPLEVSLEFTDKQLKENPGEISNSDDIGFIKFSPEQAADIDYLTDSQESFLKLLTIVSPKDDKQHALQNYIDAISRNYKYVYVFAFGSAKTLRQITLSNNKKFRTSRDKESSFNYNDQADDGYIFDLKESDPFTTKIYSKDRNAISNTNELRFDIGSGNLDSGDSGSTVMACKEPLDGNYGTKNLFDICQIIGVFTGATSETGFPPYKWFTVSTLSSTGGVAVLEAVSNTN